MCDKYYFVFDFVPDQFETHKMCDKFVSDDPFQLKYCHDRYKTQKMCDEAVEVCLAALKFVPDGLFTSKMITKLLAALYADENILYFLEDYSDAVFPCNEMGILIIDCNKIILDDTNYDEVNPEIVIHIRRLDWYVKLEKCKALKKELNEELMLVAYYPKRWWNFV